MKTALAALLVFSCSTAVADPIILRMATVAPEGTLWAREMHTHARDLEAATNGRIKIKWYMNGVAGGEMETLERINKGQLDGAMSGHMGCERVAPSMRVLRVPGMFQSREEATDTMNRLQPVLEKEAAQKGVFLSATTGLGPDVIFTRTPVKTMAELRKLRLWRWNLDEVGIAASRAMGLDVVPTEVYDAGKTYDHDQLDGFIAIPAAALAFQWSTRAKYVIDLRHSYLYGCAIYSQKWFQALPVDLQTELRASAARVRLRFDEVGRQMDEQLLSGAFQKQGVKVLQLSGAFRAEFFSAARQAREALVDKAVPRALIDRTLQMLADFRAEHGK
jgi:TRAP-type C4-dicarboxylate transport system substrate-binding protein